MELFHYFPGTLPFILNIPHAGTYIPKEILDRFEPLAQQLPDTDWHLERLYSFAKTLGVHLLVATHSRFVIDLNRAPDDQSLYPGKFTTGLCPTTLFDGTAIYRPSTEPNEEEIRERRAYYWHPYHQKLKSLINQLKSNGPVILFDAHSIRSEVPKLFDGLLPSLNLGTADGLAVSDPITSVLNIFCKQSTYSSVINGRFKGGYITRHYGNPKQGVDAIQLELAQSNYMNEDYPFTYDPEKAKHLQKALSTLLSLLIKRL